jgi:hypothetical protein
VGHRVHGECVTQIEHEIGEIRLETGEDHLHRSLYIAGPGIDLQVQVVAEDIVTVAAGRGVTQFPALVGEGTGDHGLVHLEFQAGHGTVGQDPVGGSCRGDGRQQNNVKQSPDDAARGDTVNRFHTDNANT